MEMINVMENVNT